MQIKIRGATYQIVIQSSCMLTINGKKQLFSFIIFHTISFIFLLKDSKCFKMKNASRRSKSPLGMKIKFKIKLIKTNNSIKSISKILLSNPYIMRWSIVIRKFKQWEISWKNNLFLYRPPRDKTQNSSWPSWRQMGRVLYTVFRLATSVLSWQLWGWTNVMILSGQKNNPAMVLTAAFTLKTIKIKTLLVNWLNLPNLFRFL